MTRLFFGIAMCFVSLGLRAEPTAIGAMADTSSIWRLFLALGFLVILIPLIMWGLKRLQGLQGKLSRSEIRIIATQSVGAKERLLLVEVEGCRLLLGTTPQHITCLKEFGSGSEQFAELMNEQLADDN